MFYLDSCTCINFLRGNAQEAHKVMRASDPRLFGIPAVVEAELRVEAEKSRKPRENLLLLERFLLPFAIIPFDSDCACEYATICAYLEKRGVSMRPNDLLAAATARSHNATLVTDNVQEFKQIPGLRLETWCDVELRK